MARSTAGPFRPCDAGPLRSGGDLYPLSDYQVHGDDGDYWGGVAAFHTFRQACALLPEQGSDDRAVCSAVYGQLLLHPEGAKAHLPEIIAVMEPLAQDPTDASARLRLYELRDLLQEDA